MGLVGYRRELAREHCKKGLEPEGYRMVQVGCKMAQEHCKQVQEHCNCLREEVLVLLV